MPKDIPDVGNMIGQYGYNEIYDKQSLEGAISSLPQVCVSATALYVFDDVDWTMRFQFGQRIFMYFQFFKSLGSGSTVGFTGNEFAIQAASGALDFDSINFNGTDQTLYIERVKDLGFDNLLFHNASRTTYKAVVYAQMFTL